MRMHVDEVEIEPALVARLVGDQFPQWSRLPIEPVPFFGTDNATYRLGDDLAVRLPRREKNVETLEKELLWLPRLAPRLPLAIPTPVAVGKAGAGYPFSWAVYRWVDGENVAVLSAGATGDLVAFIAALQRIDPDDGPPPGAHNASRGEPLARRDPPVRSALEALGGTIDGDAAAAVWDRALAAPEWSGPPVWIHGDLDARNVLVRDRRLSGVIDFGCLGVGDPACDVMVAWKLFSADDRESFRAALAVDDATWTRARGWALSQALGALSYYTEENNPALVRAARRWLTEALAD
jgi:aminoglycoside phosphotransferase (APT) family kinase protein